MINRSIVCLLALLLPVLGFAQDPMSMTTPPPEMKDLAFMLGQWEAKEKIFDQGKEIMTMEGTVDCKMVVGGRYLHSMYSGEMSNGIKMEGLMMLTYDPEDRMYRGTWFDNSSAMSVVAQGKLKDGALKMESEPFEMPFIGMVSIRLTYTKAADDKVNFLLEMKPEHGEWFKQMESVYHKKS